MSSNERKKLSVFDSKYVYFSKLECLLMDDGAWSSNDRQLFPKWPELTLSVDFNFLTTVPVEIKISNAIGEVC